MPERFLRVDGSWNPDARDPSVAFGFGRRICPGRFIARETLWIAIASILSSFTISAARDENGKELIPDEAHLPGGIV